MSCAALTSTKIHHKLLRSLPVGTRETMSFTIRALEIPLCGQSYWLSKRIPYSHQCFNSTQSKTQALEGFTHRPINSLTAYRPELTTSTCPRGNSSFNIADQFQDHLRKDGHRVWGVVVYRCTYGDNAAWETCLERLNARIREPMHFYNGLDLLEEGRFKLTVMHDPSRFEGASARVVRRHFKEWRKHAVHEEQGTNEEIAARRPRPEMYHHAYGTAELDEDLWTGLAGEAEEVDEQPSLIPEIGRYGLAAAAVRYRLCVQIDEAALQSIISPAGEEYMGESWVNIVDADWDPEVAAAQREYEKVRHVKNGLDLEDFDDEVEVFIEIDGCTEEYVGWMKVPYQDLIPEFYSSMMEYNAFGQYYVRPPDICRW